MAKKYVGVDVHAAKIQKLMIIKCGGRRIQSRRIGWPSNAANKVFLHMLA